MRIRTTSDGRPGGVTALSIFFMAGAAVSLISSVSLLVPQSFLEPMWRLNPRAHEAFAGMGSWSISLLGAVSAACASAAVSLWRGARWGRWLAVALIAVNLLGDIGNTLSGIEPRAAIGIPIALAILVYLMTGRVRRFFDKPTGI